MNNEDFNYLIGYDDEYEKPIIEIHYQDKFVALINQEKGIDKLGIEFYRHDIDYKHCAGQLDLNDFIKSLDEAKEILLKK